MKTNLGKVAITPKGVWNATTAYAALDTVNFGGGSWLAKRGNIAVTPTEGDDWMQLSAKGADAEVTKDSIVGALGFTPEKDYGNYELIETITLTEDTAAAVTRTAEPNGTAYNFSKAIIICSAMLANGVAGSYGVYINSDSKHIHMITNIQASKTKISVYEVEIRNGCVFGKSYSLADTANYHNNVEYIPTANTFSGDAGIGTITLQQADSINSMRISQFNSYPFASGTVFKIYAVRI